MHSHTINVADCGNLTTVLSLLTLPASSGELLCNCKVSVRLFVCPVDGKQQRRAACCGRSGAGSRYRSISAAVGRAAGSVMLRAEVRSLPQTCYFSVLLLLAVRPISGKLSLSEGAHETRETISSLLFVTSLNADRFPSFLLLRSWKILPSSNAQRSRHTANILLTGLWIDRATLWAAMAVYLCVTSRSSIKTVERIELVFGVVASFHMSYTQVEGNCGISKIRVQSSGILSQTLSRRSYRLQLCSSRQDSTDIARREVRLR